MLSAAARAIPRSRLQLRAVSTWSNVPAGPPDPILGMAQLKKHGQVKSTESEVSRCDGGFQGG